MKRVVITGASGFVGANLSRRILAEGHELHLLLRKEYSPWRIESLKKDVQIHIVDLNDPERLFSLISSLQPDWIFHLAAYGAYSSQASFNRMVETNLLATSNLVNVCAQVGFDAFINTGSSSEYGFKDHAPSEEEYLQPNSTYAITKAAGTHYCQYKAQAMKLNLATFRLYSVFGPFEEPNRLFPSLIINGLQGKLPPLVNPMIARDYIFINDVVDTYIRIANNPHGISGKIYNIGTGKQTSIKEIVSLACQELNILQQPVWGSMHDRQWDTSIWIAEINKISTELGWKPQYTLADGFKRFIEWFKSNPDMFQLYISHSKLPE